MFSCFPKMHKVLGKNRKGSHTHTLKWRETSSSIDGHMDWPLAQGDKLQITNGSQDEKQENKTNFHPCLNLAINKTHLNHCQGRRSSCLFIISGGKKGILGRWQLMLELHAEKQSQKKELYTVQTSVPLFSQNFHHIQRVLPRVRHHTLAQLRTFLCLN